MAIRRLMQTLGYVFGWMGKLPGDIHYTRGNFSFYFPLMTCLVVSAVISLLFWWFRR